MMFRRSVINRHSVPIVCAIALSLCGALPAAGQVPEQMKLRIHLNEPLCQEARGKVINDISVSINGRDYEFTPLAKDPLAKMPDCEWESRKIDTLDPNISFFSLRLARITIGDKGQTLSIEDKGRTRCRKSKLLGKSTLEMWFGERGTDPVKRLTVSGDPLHYARIANAKIQNQGPGHTDIACDERGKVPGKLVGVQFDIEEVRFQIFPKKNIKCDLVVDASDRVAKAPKGTELDYKERLADILALQGLKAERCHAPTYIPPELIKESLRGQERSLKVTVN